MANILKLSRPRRLRTTASSLPEVPDGPYAALLSLIVDERYVPYVKNNFPLERSDAWYGDHRLVPGKWQLNLYLGRLYVSKQQFEWLLGHASIIERHWMMFRDATHEMPAVRVR